MKKWICIWLIMSAMLPVVTSQAQPVKQQPIYATQVPHDDTTAISTLTLIQPEMRLLYDTVGYQWISYKAKVDFEGEGLNNSCQLFFVNRIDSIIYLNFHVSGIEILRVVLTPNDVTLVNKLDHAYYQGGYEVFQKLVGMQADFHFIQALFNKCDFCDFEHNLQVVNDDVSVWKMVSPMRRHRSTDWSIMQTVEKNLSSGELKNEITDLTSGRVLTAVYASDTVARYSQLVLSTPVRGMKVTITPKGYKYNVPGPTSIKIPDKFTRLIFE